MSLSDYLENKLVDHVLGGTAYNPAVAGGLGTIYLALSTANPTDDGTGMAEPADTYQRQAITFNAASARVLTGIGTISFPQAGASQGTISHWALFDAQTNGNMLAHGELSALQAVNAGNTPSISGSAVTVTFSANGLSDYLANKLLDFAFRNQAFTQPTVYVGLATVAITDANTGANVTEETGTNYARVAHSGWNAAASGSAANSTDISFATAGAGWGTTEGMFLVDALTAVTGNILFYDNSMSQAVGDGDTVKSSAGNFTCSLN